MATLLEDIVSFITANGQVTGDGVDAFRDFTPETPDNIVAIKEYSGDPMVFGESLTNRSVQLTVRNTDASISQSKALAIFKLFKSDDFMIHFTSTRWGQVHLRQTPFRISTDASNRVTYGFNIGITTTID